MRGKIARTVFLFFFFFSKHIQQIILWLLQRMANCRVSQKQVLMSFANIS